MSKKKQRIAELERRVADLEGELANERQLRELTEMLLKAERETRPIVPLYPQWWRDTPDYPEPFITYDRDSTSSPPLWTTSPWVVECIDC